MPKETMITCPKCHGRGWYEVPKYIGGIYNPDIEWEDVPIKYEKVPCEMCHTKGKITLQFYEEIQRKCRGK